MSGQMTFPIEAPSSNGKARTTTATQAPPSVSSRPPTPAVLSVPDAPPAELVAGVPDRESERRDLEGLAVGFGLWAVRLVAALNSYEHMRSLALVAGEGWRSWLLPVSVDGLAIVALVKIRRARRHDLPNKTAWVALGLSLCVSLAANVAAAVPSDVGRVVAAWPPVALLLAEVIDNRHQGGAGANRPAPVPSNPLMGGG